MYLPLTCIDFNFFVYPISMGLRYSSRPNLRRKIIKICLSDYIKIFVLPNLVISSPVVDVLFVLASDSIFPFGMWCPVVFTIP